MAKTARQIITSALRKLGVVASGETPSADELQDGLSALQGLIDSWSASDLLAYSETKETLTLVPSQQDYTIGTGGDFNTARPAEILGVSVLETSGLEHHLDKLTFEQWQSISLKSTGSNIPKSFYFETAWPMAKLHFYPVPSEAKQIVLYSRKPLVTVSTVNSSIDLPLGYEDALVYNLALEISDEYGAQVSALTLKKAEDSLSAIKTQNLASKIPYAATDRAMRGTQGRSGWSLSDFMKGGS